MTLELSKKLAGEKAIDFVEDGDVVGLGTGSTTEYSIKTSESFIITTGIEGSCNPSERIINSTIIYFLAT